MVCKIPVQKILLTLGGAAPAQLRRPQRMKHFLVINTSFFGDTLLTDPLCRNIKHFFPDSYITFIVNKPFYEIALYMDGVDNVIAYDKQNAHRGLSGAWRFYHYHKKLFTRTRPIDAAFIIYGNERNILLSKLFGAKKIYAIKNGLIRLLLSNSCFDCFDYGKMQDINSSLLQAYTKKPFLRLPMLYKPPQAAQQKGEVLLKELSLKSDDFICLSPVSKKSSKDMPLATCLSLLRLWPSLSKKRLLLLGAGQRCKAYSEALHKALPDSNLFVDLTDKTSLTLLGAILRLSSGLISVDTGTMHLGLASQIPVTALFYLNDLNHLKKWAPDPELYNSAVLSGADLTAEKIANTCLALISYHTKKGTY